jgi:hypothetical protein
MTETEDVWIALFIILIFVAFFSGLVLGAILSPSSPSRHRRHGRKRHARLAAAEPADPPDLSSALPEKPPPSPLPQVTPQDHPNAGEPGKKRSMNLPAVLTALSAVSGLIVLDHFNGPLFPDVFYCLNDGGTQTTRMCTGRVPP